MSLFMHFWEGFSNHVSVSLLIYNSDCIVNEMILTSIEMFYLNFTLNFGIPPVLVIQLEVYYKVDSLLNGLTTQQKGTTARCYSNKTSLNKKMIS